MAPFILLNKIGGEGLRVFGYGLWDETNNLKQIKTIYGGEQKKKKKK